MLEILEESRRGLSQNLEAMVDLKTIAGCSEQTMVEKGE
jgi:hypothetical protein